ncbi:MAG TPA: Ppx/GppA phosphatase family protein [Sedimentisphaerales bacterium]|nr:Ppx/GppA phosphatase family protein [Sedimentisphaerales bacterium]HRS11619.1 Ppx/GppA phosphatase family protein [Sedimentisphaerales bacterium]HRV48282.1 Ppx/GppA phosphatase family protein [Sedimentisphaerales bacterium]
MPTKDKKSRTVALAETMAVIDIGSNSIRMMIGQALPDGRLEIVERLRRAVRLGQDVFRTGRIRAETMRSALGILRDYRHVLNTYGIHRIRAVATSAVREAANGDSFVDRALMAAGLEVSVISVTEEGRLTVSAVRKALGEKLLRQGKALVVEVGGGSTVLNLLNHGEIAASQSLPTGSVRMQEVLATTMERADQAARLIQHQITSAMAAFRSLLPLKSVQTFIAVGGDARWAAAQVGKPMKAISLVTVSSKALGKLLDRCRLQTADELARSYKIAYTDAETIVPALLVYQVLLETTRAERMIVSDVSMRDGLLLDLARSAAGKKDDAAYREIIQSAQSVAQKYQVDTSHAEQTRCLAVQLFDQLAGEHRLGERHRFLLEVAAILHEVGTFVASRAHHKHSFYLIANSEIVGLTQDELAVVANVARYHRRSRPKPSHLDYIALPRERRMIVNKLASLLRVAEALDSSRTQQVQKLQSRIEGSSLIISVKAGGDYTLERRALAEVGDMMLDIYGLEVRLEEAGQV